MWIRKRESFEEEKTMWKIFFNYKDKSRCTVKGKGTITPELAVKVRFNTRKDKTMTEVILFLPFLIIAIMILLSD